MSQEFIEQIMTDFQWRAVANLEATIFSKKLSPCAINHEEVFKNDNRDTQPNPIEIPLHLCSGVSVTCAVSKWGNLQFGGHLVPGKVQPWLWVYLDLHLLNHHHKSEWIHISGSDLERGIRCSVCKYH